MSLLARTVRAGRAARAAMTQLAGLLAAGRDA
jgi:hypothetical protein